MTGITHAHGKLQVFRFRDPKTQISSDVKINKLNYWIKYVKINEKIC